MDYFEKLKEKAKAYDEALKLIKECTPDENGFVTIYPNEIFPELAESEDERIRKDCIKYLDWEYQHCPFNEDKMKIEKCVAWLEKQDNKVIDCSQNHQDSNRPNGCIVFEDFNGGEGFYKLHLDYLNKKQLEEVEELVRTWNKESTYSVWVGGDEINDHYLTKDEAEKLADKYRKNGYDDVVVEEIKQRPAKWHGEDEQNLNTCLGYIPDEFLRRWLTDIIHVKYDKPDWSEEDEMYLIRVTNAVKRYFANPWRKEVIKWLKSLKERMKGE